MKTSVMERLPVVVVIIVMVGIILMLGFPANAAETYRVISIKSVVSSKTPEIRLKDLVTNKRVLTDVEQELVVMDTPKAKDESIGIVEIAYMLQKHPEMENVRIKGARNITVQKLVDTSMVDKAKRDIIEQIKKESPWKDWDIDVLLSLSDEAIVTKAAPFSKVEVLPSENRNMLGTVNLNIAFIDENGKQVGKSSINPTILKKVMVSVMNSNCKQGQILTQANIQLTPMWLGPEGRNYISNPEECIGRELAKSMAAGEIIRTTDVLNPVCAKKGDVISVECHSGALMVKISAVALDNGRQGENIRVMNQTSRKSFTVELIGEKTASMNAGG